jgi:phospholipid/cholesterol/gamma-HCH transport system substrate-binding protein
MSDSPDPLLSRPPEPADAAAVSAGRLSDERLEFRAVLLLAFMLALIVGSALYVMYARGMFESTQKLVLMAEDSEGVVVGMNLTFSGFPIGRVRHIELAEDGKARIVVDVSSKDAHWLRTSSVFTLVRGLVGSTNIRAYTGLLADPLLPDGAVRTVLQGDAAGEVPKLIASAKDLIESLSSLTGSNGSLGASLGNLQVLTTRLNGTGGALAVLLGGEAEAKKLQVTLDRSNALLAKLDTLAAKAEVQVFGEKRGQPWCNLMPCWARRAPALKKLMPCWSRHRPWVPMRGRRPMTSARYAAKLKPACARLKALSTRSTANGRSNATPRSSCHETSFQFIDLAGRRHPCGMLIRPQTTRLAARNQGFYRPRCSCLS